MNKGFTNILLLVIIGTISLFSGIFLTYKTNQSIERVNENYLGVSVSSTLISDTIGTFRTNVNGSLERINASLSDSTSTDPGHKHTTSTITGITYLKPISEGGTANTTFTKGLVTASGTDAMSSLAVNSNGSIPIASGTAWVANTLTAGENITVTNSAGSISISGSGTFGGTESDGALNVSSGVTTLDLTSSSTKVFNYSSISITGTGQLAFSNPHASGTIIMLRSKGAVNITSSAVAILATSTGAIAAGKGMGSITDTNFGIVASGATGGAGGAASIISTFNPIYFVKFFVGAGGGSGGGGEISGAGGAGGRGGGALIIECNGAYNFTSTISVAGGVGANGSTGETSNTGYNGGGGGGGGGQLAGVTGSNGGSDGDGNDGGGGGGGGGGYIGVFYNSLTADSGTYNVSGGAGGTATSPAGAGGAGGAGNAIRALNYTL